MKKTVFLFISTLLLLSCGASHTEDAATRSILNGSWVLESLSFDSEGTYEITLFDNIPAKCIEQTRWNFRASNSKGSFEITDESCSTLPQNHHYIWTIPNKKKGYNYSLLLKPVDEKGKSQINNQGYRMGLEQLNNDRMTWRYNLPVDGKPFVLKFNFKRSLINPY